MPGSSLRDLDRGCDAIPPLLGHTVGITGHRRVDELTGHLRSLGATVLHGPMLHTRPMTDELLAVRRATEAIIARPPRYLLATTGIGMRSWINDAALLGMRSELLAALARTQVLARGPKVVGALSEAGIEAAWTVPSGRTEDMVDELVAGHLAGAHVALQLPGAPMPEILARLRGAGAAEVTTVAVYEWTWPDDLAAPRRLLRAVADGRLSAVTFTSRPAVRNFVALATDEGIHRPVVRALRSGVLPICIGASTADELEALTGATPSSPALPMLGMLVQQVAGDLRRVGHHHLRTPKGDDIVVQGRYVDGAGVAATTSEREAAVLHRLLATPRSTVGRDELLRAVWGTEDVDPSVLETTMARLRRRLASTGLTILTITSRGYLLGGEVVPCPRPANDDPRPGLIEAH